MLNGKHQYDPQGIRACELQIQKPMNLPLGHRAIQVRSYDLRRMDYGRLNIY